MVLLLYGWLGFTGYECDIYVIMCRSRMIFIYLFIYLEALIKQYITNIEQKNKKRDVFDKGQ